MYEINQESVGPFMNHRLGIGTQRPIDPTICRSGYYKDKFVAPSADGGATLLSSH